MLTKNYIKSFSRKTDKSITALISLGQTGYVDDRFIGGSDRFIADILETTNLENIGSYFFNRDVNRGRLVYIFSLRFSGSKFLLNLRRQFHVRKNFSYTVFCGI